MISLCSSERCRDVDEGKLSDCQFLKLPRRHGTTFAAERLDALWRNRDAYFKGIFASVGDKICSHPTGRVAHFKSARACDNHDLLPLFPESKKDETKFQ